jgi:hypothetical protein
MLGRRETQALSRDSLDPGPVRELRTGIRRSNSHPDQSKCDHNSQWDYNRNICMRCGITKLEILRSVAGKRP